jgi:hypothetical protein
MKTWKEFWLEQEQDIMEVLANNILNFATLLGVLSIWIKAAYPQYYDSFNSLITGYLLVAPSAKKS